MKLHFEFELANTSKLPGKLAQADFARLPQVQLERMAEAGTQILECYRG